MLIEMTLAQFADQTAARTPTPGGGSVAAGLAAFGAALGAMAARFTQGRKGFESHEAALAQEIASLDSLRGQLLRLVDADAASYDKVTAAYGLPKGTLEEKAARQAAIESALKEAMATPLRTCGLTVEALSLLDGLRGHVNKNLASDVAVGAYALGAAFRGAWINVLINLGGLKDEALRARVLADGEDLGGRASALERGISAAIVADLGG